MTREQAKKILSEMTLEECVCMWNDDCSYSQRSRNAEIRRVSDDEWWSYLAKILGGYHLMLFLLTSDGLFDRDDEYFFFNEDDSSFYSFDTKEELFFLFEEWFIDELTNGN